MKISSLYRIPSILLLATTLDCNGTRIGSPKKRDKNGHHHPERSLGSTSSKEKKEKSHEVIAKKPYVRDESIPLVSCIIIIVYLDT